MVKNKKKRSRLYNRIYKRRGGFFPLLLAPKLIGATIAASKIIDAVNHNKSKKGGTLDKKLLRLNSYKKNSRT